MVWADILNGIQQIIDFFGEIGSYVVNLLPNSPFQMVENLGIEADWLSYLNWLLPMKAILAELQLWVSAIACYYIYMTILRWVKTIQ